MKSHHLRAATTLSPRLSVIVPTKNNANTLKRLLDSIEIQNGGPWEVIVVDNFSNDDTVGIARRHTPYVYTHGPERSAQRNFGAARAHSEYLVFIDSDMELTQGLLDACAVKLEQYDAICLRERILSGGSYWAKVRALEREACFRSLIFEAARGFRLNIFNALGGYDVRMTGQEDMDLEAKLLERRLNVGWVDIPVLHHEEGITPVDYLSKRRRYGLTDSVLAKEHPEYYATLRSPLTRARVVLSYCHGKPLLGTVATLPGLGALRFAEFIVRSFQSRGP